MNPVRKNKFWFTYNIQRLENKHRHTDCTAYLRKRSTENNHYFSIFSKGRELFFIYFEACLKRFFFLTG
ncbi:MAG: hypothetical protein COY66_03025 [Candidatus Kerfeldbacteria bacterium CG_4_10_14_0_8_um_filter_42_10]|uniref:Uncharacterized protein n=1 Tax=Candidatus Kerfeldbacteria bacterium CG_4_10_14_0_8_um_filter_42_10 TaxID=2014248 RepID=A0A2M7RK06_9BACT|nr:MAG: hypothetical protein COY66_03025 [Candidatus Kerfeldbacteria bacterium CG_4_10_14_0_8_um_filter_42_10]